MVTDLYYEYLLRLLLTQYIYGQQKLRNYIITCVE